ncbi:HmuY family protein [Flavobacterium sp.]|uniref:HmuY family protein n=1 Tax=Flavobacterium sp. TaxID=239 RepID=UPI003B9B3264
MKHVFSFLTLFLLVFTSCEKDNDSAAQNSVGFSSAQLNLVESSTDIVLNFETAAAKSGVLELTFTGTNAVLGTDFNLSIAPTSANNLEIPYEVGATTVSFQITRLTQAIEGQAKSVAFQLTGSSDVNVTVAPEAASLVANFNEVPVTQLTKAPAVGGPNVPNIVYVDLSSGAELQVPRASFDLGFYSGSEFRVVLNGALKMAAKQLAVNDMTIPQEIDPSVAVGEGGGTGVVNGNPAYVDDPSGNLAQTAIAEVAANDADNKVYLINRGFDVATAAPGVGSVNAYGNSRGWLKIRVLRNGNGYKIQYAAPEATTFSEVLVAKNADYHFTYVNLTTGNTVVAQPEKNKWDLQFTPFTNYTNFGTGTVSYAFQDFIVSNALGGTRIYQVLNSEGVLYANYSLANVNTANFETTAAADQRVIGSSWRNGGGPTSLPSARDDRFYILKDTAGNIYKLRFISLVNAQGERGNPSFEYQKLN